MGRTGKVGGTRGGPVSTLPPSNGVSKTEQKTAKVVGELFEGHFANHPDAKATLLREGVTDAPSPKQPSVPPARRSSSGPSPSQRRPGAKRGVVYLSGGGSQPSNHNSSTAVYAVVKNLAFSGGNSVPDSDDDFGFPPGTVEGEYLKVGEGVEQVYGLGNVKNAEDDAIGGGLPLYDIGTADGTSAGGDNSKKIVPLYALATDVGGAYNAATQGGELVYDLGDGRDEGPAYTVVPKDLDAIYRSKDPAKHQYEESQPGGDPVYDKVGHARREQRPLPELPGSDQKNSDYLDIAPDEDDEKGFGASGESPKVQSVWRRHQKLFIGLGAVLGLGAGAAVGAAVVALSAGGGGAAAAAATTLAPTAIAAGGTTTTVLATTTTTTTTAAATVAATTRVLTTAAAAASTLSAASTAVTQAATTVLSTISSLFSSTNAATTATTTGTTTPTTTGTTTPTTTGTTTPTTTGTTTGTTTPTTTPTTTTTTPPPTTTTTTPPTTTTTPPPTTTTTTPPTTTTTPPPTTTTTPPPTTTTTKCQNPRSIQCL